MDYDSEKDLLGEPQIGLSGFLDPQDFDPASSASSSSASVSFPGASPYSRRPVYDIGEESSGGICNHGRRKNTCRECYNKIMTLRESKGLPRKAWGVFCEHGYNKHTKGNKCPYSDSNPDCKPFTTYSRSGAYAASTPSRQFFTGSSDVGADVGESVQYQEGFIPASARTFEPPIPNRAGLSFSQLHSSEVNPVKQNLFGTRVFDSDSDGDKKMEQGGGSSYKKAMKKARSRKVKRSCRKSKRSCRKSKRSSRR